VHGVSSNVFENIYDADQWNIIKFDNQFVHLKKYSFISFFLAKGMANNYKTMTRKNLYNYPESV
jgi:hypothetical protein